MNLKRIFARREKDDFTDPAIDEVENQVQQSTDDETPETTEPTSISSDAVQLISKVFRYEKIKDELKHINWIDAEVSDIVSAFRNQINEFVISADVRIKISYISYLVSYAINQYNEKYVAYYHAYSARNFEAFIQKILQAVYDICIVHNISFYHAFTEIKELSVRSILDGNVRIETIYYYSFSNFANLWEESGSKCFFDKKEKNIKPIVQIYSDFFEELLENASDKDIEALLKFSIKNEDVIEESFVKKLEEAITDEYYEPGCYIDFDAAIAIGNSIPHLLVPAYINSFNKNLYYMKNARDNLDEASIACLEEEMFEILSHIQIYQEYRSEDFREYFEHNWEWLLGILLNYYSGYIITFFSDLICGYFGVNEAFVESDIISFVRDTIFNYDFGENAVVDEYGINDAYRLSSNKIIFDAIDSENSSIFNIF